MRKIYQKMYLTNKNRSEGVLGGFIDNVILHSCNSESRPLSFKRAGFTLIELLVVVLILGILAAVAMPSYRRAVATARVGTLLPLMRSISDAESRFYMANNRYSQSFSALDISMPSGGELKKNSVGTEVMSYVDFHCYFHMSADAAAQGSSSSLYCASKKVSGLSIEKYFGSRYFICWAGQNEAEEANVLCQNISGRDTHNAITSTGYGYTF